MSPLLPACEPAGPGRPERWWPCVRLAAGPRCRQHHAGQAALKPRLGAREARLLVLGAGGSAGALPGPGEAGSPARALHPTPLPDGRACCPPPQPRSPGGLEGARVTQQAGELRPARDRHGRPLSPPLNGPPADGRPPRPWGWPPCGRDQTKLLAEVFPPAQGGPGTLDPSGALDHSRPEIRVPQRGHVVPPNHTPAVL